MTGDHIKVGLVISSYLCFLVGFRVLLRFPIAVFGRINIICDMKVNTESYRLHSKSLHN